MYKYYTKAFYKEEDNIDEWINSFQKDKPLGEYNFEVIGYCSFRSGVIITIKIWELVMFQTDDKTNPKNDL